MANDPDPPFTAAQRRAFTRLTFTPPVRAAQQRYGSREAMERLEAMPRHDRLTPEIIEVITRCNSFLIGTASVAGWPHIQHRGGPPGFLQVLDEQTLAFGDFEGNRQYITVGNLAENTRVFLFLINYEEGTRLKLWGRAKVIEGDPELLALVTGVPNVQRIARLIHIHIEAWDLNCRQHIPALIPKAHVEALIKDYEQKLAAAEARPAALLRAMLGPDLG
jgi:predicted pyridoxine 5'-phosphate oxidase superfamily flavin-nucleotide-binding protein